MTICAHPASCIGARPETVLKSVFGYDSFRPLQKEIIENVLNGKDTLAVMPTGGGKSLCYQIPALILDGLTIVVSPLIALMQDQVSSLESSGVDAVFLNSSLEWAEYCKAADSIRAGTTKLVYVSPEGLATQRLQDLLHSDGVKINCITVDEAHCISEWGHDFRPDYMEIASFREQFPQAVCLALTATATKQVRDDIVRILCMKSPDVLVASFNRENIFLEVQQKRNALGQVTECIGRHKDESGIIYCFSRREVDSLTSALSDLGYSVLNYHAGLSDKDRTDHQERFIKDRVQIMVATVAFGMGIDKPNVRFVIHYDMPKSLEQYYQEIGRAGRDGLPADALLLFSSADIHKIRYFFDESADREKSELLLKHMIDYATARTCRRRMLLSYFGEDLETESEPCCDVCSAGPAADSDVTVPVQKLLCCMIRTKERFGAAYVIDVLLGSRNKRIADNGHTMISTWGIGKDLAKEDWFALADACIQAGYICKSDDFGVLSVSSRGRAVLASRESICLPVRLEGAQAGMELEKRFAGSGIRREGIHRRQKAALPAKTIDSNDGEAVRIASALKEWRRRRADEDSVAPYMVFGDRTIADIAAKKPANERQLTGIYGIGQAKADRYGPAIIRIVTDGA